MNDPASTPRIAWSRTNASPAKARLASSSETVKPMPPSAPAAIRSPNASFWSPPPAPSLWASQPAPAMPTILPDRQRDQNAPERRGQIGCRHLRDRNERGREREDREHDHVDPGLDRVSHPQGRSLRHRKTEQHAGDRRVHAGCEHEHPGRDREDQRAARRSERARGASSMRLRIANATTASSARASIPMLTSVANSTAMKTIPTMSSRIARASRNTRTEVGRPSAEHGEHAEREGDVGRGRAPATPIPTPLPARDREVDGDRHDDTAGRGDRRLDRPPEAAQLAAGELVLQLDRRPRRRRSRAGRPTPSARATGPRPCRRCRCVRTRTRSRRRRSASWRSTSPAIAGDQQQDRGESRRAQQGHYSPSGLGRSRRTVTADQTSRHTGLHAIEARGRHVKHVTSAKHRRTSVDRMREFTQTEAIDLVGRFEAGQEIPERMRADVRMLGSLLGSSAARERLAGSLRGRRAPARRDDPRLHRRHARGVRERRRDRRLVHDRSRRRGRAGVHRVLPPREPRRGAPARAHPARARRSPRPRGCDRLGRRRVRAPGRRGRR